ncbi:glycoside hydrolase domain-containing protein [Sutcliffiella halmapala]|uniref:glycoside hydrolase domain-containing protein n=1 Tax=Sutcliffiella halmapala TaxID=79882 RepID=UPI000995A82A|nr:glycoside hydrolase domain-containing protein [Sutcliffiella halmapala]
MTLGKNTFIAIAASLFLLLGFTSFLFLYEGNSETALTKADTVTEANTNASNQSNNNININITNNIQNNIYGDGTTKVESTITNDIKSDATSNINNSVENNVDGDGNTTLSNTLDNELNGESSGELENNIKNNMNGNGKHSIENNLFNNFGVSVNIDVQNNVTNETQNNENGDGNGNGNDDGNNEDENGNSSDDLADIIWGIDSASETTEEFYACVKENFGDPVVFGRYLGEREGVSHGLTSNQVDLIQEEGDYILPIYNHFNDARGYDNGVAQAEEAIRFANELGIPEGVAIFADIEPEYPVDSAFILGWYETMASSEYESGIYGIFAADSELANSYITASEDNSEILENNIIWTAAPNIGITTEAEAPEFEPEAPEDSLAWGWQYGIDSETCNIDTNLFNSEIVDVLWSPET